MKRAQEGPYAVFFLPMRTVRRHSERGGRGFTISYDGSRLRVVHVFVLSPTVHDGRVWAAVSIWL